VVHIDTSYKLKEIYGFGDRLVKEWNLNLIIARNEEVLRAGIDPSMGRLKCCTFLKASALKQAIKSMASRRYYLVIRRDSMA